MQPTRFPVIYLTGAPATGKSTLSENLAARYGRLRVFAYSQELRHFIAHRTTGIVSEDEIRAQSGTLITAEDVAALDRHLVNRVSTERLEAPFLIDSHPVTKESYGFRVTCFDSETLLKLNPDVIVCLYTSAEIAVERIRRDPMGRPLISPYEAQMHTNLQTSVAAQYGVITGRPVYFLDSSVSQQQLVETVALKAHLSD